MQESSHAPIQITSPSGLSMNTDLQSAPSSSSSLSSSSSSKNDRNLEKNSRSTSPSGTAMIRKNSQARRPRRATSQKVDYNLKRRRIIPSEDYSQKGRRDEGERASQEDKMYSELNADNLPLDNDKNTIEVDEFGTVVHINEPKNLEDCKNGATGLPLSQGPSDKVKKEYLWCFKKVSSTSSNLNSRLENAQLKAATDHILLEDKIYKSKLKTTQSDTLTSLSGIREKINPRDIHAQDRDKLIDDSQNEIIKKELDGHNGHQHSTNHIKIKATISSESKNKLFGQNSIANLPPGSSSKNISSRLTTPVEEIENDDFCSACSQTGSFLCCDTCPRSFHFLCLNPPLNPDNLPEGDWSCPQCTFKLKYPNITQTKKVEKEFIQNELSSTHKLFGKLLFQLKARNPKQFKLPHSIKDTFANVRTGSRGQYVDDREKDTLSEKQLFGTPYGQSITKLDSYNPDSHFDVENGELLLCYKCGMAKMGTWDNPADSRLIMRCDYCRTPWHLDCVPDVPRASLKNLGTNWKCPLHAPLEKHRVKQRKLARNQKFVEPGQTCGYKNNGIVEIVLDEISAPGTKPMIDADRNIDDFPPIPVLEENSVRLDFMDKIYRAKKVQREKELKCQEHLIDKLIVSSLPSKKSSKRSELEELMYFLYFTLHKNPHLKKLWDFKELCNVAEVELEKEQITSSELQQLILVKKILESKPKEEIMKFFDLK